MTGIETVSRRARQHLILATVAVAGLLAPGAAAQTPGQVPGEISGTATGARVPEFLGEPAPLRPVEARPNPRHPFMAANGRSNLHVDAFQSDAHFVAGPLGLDPEVNSAQFIRECASITFDRAGRIVTVCVGLDKPVLALLDPVDFTPLATYDLPPREVSPNPFTDFSGGGYFYLDHRDRVVAPTTDGHIKVIGQAPGPTFELVADYDLTPAVGDAKVISALPDWRGRIWFAAVDGVVGWVDPKSGELFQTDLGEVISNSFAVGQGGAVYIVSDGALYRLEAGERGPEVVWRAPYGNTGTQKSGQTSPGSGTTPTLLRRRYVAITDNSDPLQVVVLRRARDPRGRRVVCRQEVFAPGAGSTDNSLIGINRSLIVENNFGYEGPLSVELGPTTTPGLERIDIAPPGKLGPDPARNCEVVWKSEEIAPSVVPKLSVANGLVYTYTKPDTGSTTDAWYLTAIDFRGGETVYKALAGYGLGFNNNYAPVTIGPDGAAYVGVLGGVVRVTDS